MSILLSLEEIAQLEECCVDCHGHDEFDVAKAQLKKVEDWLRKELDDSENEPYKGFIGFMGMAIRGERLKEEAGLT